MEIVKTVDKFADIGWKGFEENKGRDCLAYSENEDRAHELFRSEAEELAAFAERQGMKFTVEEDPFGNSYVTLHGKSPQTVMICSHLDSVVRGGRYDGIMGVSAGLSVIEEVIDEGWIPEKSISVVAFRAEESSATGKACLGSSLATGDFEVEDLKKMKQRFLGKSIYELLLDRGLSDEDLECLKKKSFINGHGLDAVIEFHTEQSSVLDSMEKPFGLVVHGIGGARRSDVVIKGNGGFESLPENAYVLRFRVLGKADHSGGTPMNGEIIGGEEMNLRKDALVEAMKILEKVGVDRMVNISVPGGAYNTIPGECVLDVAFLAGEEVPFDESEYEIVDVECERINSVQKGVAEAAMGIVYGVENVGSEMAISTNGKVRATVGNIFVTEDGGLVLNVDQRRLSNPTGEEMAERIDIAMSSLSRDLGISISEENVRTSLATPFVGGIQQVMRDVYGRIYKEEDETPVVPVEIGSMPGHDASKVIRSREDFVSGGMVFVRSRNGGISHHPQEFCSEDDMDKASDFLFEVVKRLVF